MNLNEYNQIKDSFIEAKARKALLEEQLVSLNEEHSYQDNRAKHAEKARLIFQLVAKKTQENLEFHISKLVTTALAAVFPDNIEFVVRIEAKRNKTECDLLFKEFGEEYKPLEGSGFGAVDIASFALRIAFWSLRKNRPTMILDEPMKNVSPDLHHKVSDMLQMISTKLGIQIIMVSHQEDVNIAADKTFTVSKKGKYSEVS
ncbi:MAG: hypothetical protein U9O65_02120 [Thermotogota bacterium]|nr:hypothetical protein [Thermotogota bacterium]